VAVELHTVNYELAVFVQDWGTLHWTEVALHLLALAIVPSQRVRAHEVFGAQRFPKKLATRRLTAGLAGSVDEVEGCPKFGIARHCHDVE
jgi:hypothetical protein